MRWLGHDKRTDKHRIPKTIVVNENEWQSIHRMGRPGAEHSC